MLNESLYCPDSLPNFFGLFDTTIAPTLLFYSYVPIIFISILFGVFVVMKDKSSLLSKLLLAISVFFSAWTVSNLVAWIGVHADVVLFSWQIIIFFEIGIYLLSIYFAYVYARKRDLSFTQKGALFALALPVLVLMPTVFNIAEFDIGNCEGIINYLWHYAYVVEIISIVSILFICYRTFKLKAETRSRREVAYLTLGMTLFLGLLSSSAFWGDLTGYYQIELIGPIGMVLFLASLAYNIVRFKAFNIKLLGAQALVAALIALIFGILFIRSIENVRIVTVITLFLTLIMGTILVKGVKREVESREKIEKLAKELESTNVSLGKANVRLKELDTMKSEFLSLASHQIRNPLTAIKGYASLVLDGTYGEIANKEAKEAVEHIYKSTESLVVIVSDFLDISRIEAGTMKYDFSMFDLKSLVAENVAEIMPNAEKAGLKLSFNAAPGEYKVNADMGKIKQVVGNLIDNSIKYTPKGTVDVTLSRDESKKTYLVKIADTGVGVDAEVLPTLFHKFTRAKDAHKTSVTGTGLGLFVAKKMIEAHKGRIWVESEGKGKGSQFYIELPQ